MNIVLSSPLFKFTFKTHLKCEALLTPRQKELPPFVPLGYFVCTYSIVF